MSASSATVPLQSPLIQEYVARSQWKTIMPDAGELHALLRTALLPSLEAWAARDGFTLRNPEMMVSVGAKYSVRVVVSDLKPIDSNSPPEGWTRDTAASESKYSRAFRFREDTRVMLCSPENEEYEDDSDGEGLFD